MNLLFNIGKNIENSNTIESNSYVFSEEKSKFKDLLLETLNSNPEKNLQLKESIEENNKSDLINNQKQELKKEENKENSENIQAVENHKKIEDFNEDSSSFKKEEKTYIQQNLLQKEHSKLENIKNIKREERSLIESKDSMSFKDRKTEKISKDLNFLILMENNSKANVIEKIENSEKIKNSTFNSFQNKFFEIKPNKENKHQKNESIEDIKYFVSLTANIFKGNKEILQFNSKNLNIKDKEISTKKEKKDTKEIIQESIKELMNKKKEDNNSEFFSLKLEEKEFNNKNPKIEVLISKEGNLNPKEYLKKEGEFKNQNENQFKTILEMNTQNIKNNNNLIKENSFKEILDKSITEGLEELIQKAKININKDQFSAQIRLNPAIFGYMSLDIKMENQSLVLKILVDNQEVYKRLQENLESLKNEFIKQGIQVEQFQVRMKETFLSNEHENKNLFEQFSHFENNQSHSHSKDYESYAFDLNIFSDQKEHNQIQSREKDLDSQEIVSYNFHHQKINVWG